MNRGPSSLRAAVRTVMIFAKDPRATARWYAHAFGVSEPDSHSHSDGDLIHFEIDGLELAFHPFDADINPPGRSTVVYWWVASVAATREQLLGTGATPLRGPLVIGPDRTICQLLDPFGNVLGLDGGR